MSWKSYDDIIGMPRHVSDTRARMSERDRAAQFAPFAALVGHDDAIRETARLTDEEDEIADDMAEEINFRLSAALSSPEPMEISAVYFEPDAKKVGGRNLTHTGTVKKLDPYENVLVFTDGFKVRLDRLKDIKGDFDV
ncbi:MAG: hypothetical protein LUD47_04230 [Clostridia bacterium]|nr:hypothetical protein [Clostridia bacterium]